MRKKINEIGAVECLKIPKTAKSAAELTIVLQCSLTLKKYVLG